VPKRQRYTCLVCSRVFPQGQGVVIERGGIVLPFHSKTCAVKFFKLLVERLDEAEFKKVVRELVKELEEARKLRVKAKTI
jgi:cell division FtsZ-interacting protein ZapD